jgi:tetratricopeptide (TPR) repeat protein
VELLTRVIHGEARGEKFEGQVAVGAVVLTRVKDPRFPNTIRGVIYQSGAFTAVDDKQIHLDPNDQSYKAAKAAFDKAIEIDVNYGPAYYQRGTTRIMLDLYNEAIADLSRAIELGASLDESYFNRGIAYLNLGKNNLALPDFKKALSLTDDEAMAKSIKNIIAQIS